jgi:hypothetical protein
MNIKLSDDQEVFKKQINHLYKVCGFFLLGMYGIAMVIWLIIVKLDDIQAAICKFGRWIREKIPGRRYKDQPPRDTDEE